MLLNNLSQQFVICFSSNFFYPDVNDRFLPLIHRAYLPYNTLEDMINSQISNINFPGIDANPPQQDIRMYKVSKRPAQTADQLRQKQLTLTIKNTESMLSYFICLRQFEIFLKLGQKLDLYMPNIYISLLNDGGYETFSYVYKQLTPTSISALELSYAARLGQFNTFTWSFNYNYYEVWSVNSEGKRELITTDFDPQLDFQQKYLDSDSYEYKQRPPGHEPISTKNAQKKVSGLHSISNHNNNTINTFIPHSY